MMTMKKRIQGGGGKRKRRDEEDRVGLVPQARILPDQGPDLDHEEDLMKMKI